MRKVALFYKALFQINISLQVHAKDSIYLEESCKHVENAKHGETIEFTVHSKSVSVHCFDCYFFLRMIDQMFDQVVRIT